MYQKIRNYSNLYARKHLAGIILINFLFSISFTSALAATNGFSYYSNILLSSGIITRDFSGIQNISREDALSISVGI